MFADIGRLPNQLIQTLLLDDTLTACVRVRPVICGGSRPIQQHAKPHRLAVASRSHDQVQIAREKAKCYFSRRRVQHRFRDAVLRRSRPGTRTSGRSLSSYVAEIYASAGWVPRRRIDELRPIAVCNLGWAIACRTDRDIATGP